MVLLALCSYALVEASSDLDGQIEHAKSLFDKGRTAKAKKIYEEILPSLQNRPASKQLGFVLNSMSQIAAADGTYDKAAQFAERSAETYRKINDPEGEAHAWNNKGIAEIQSGSYTVAQRDLERALSLSRTGHDPENEAQILNNLGSAYYFPGNYSDALRRYDEAMHVVEQNGSAKWGGYWRQITSFNQATLYQRLGRYEKAMEIYRQVNAASKDLTASDRAHLQANLGALYRRLGDPYKALDSYRAAQQFYSRQHDAGGEITVLKNIGIVYALDLDDLRRAESIFTAAMSLSKKTSNRREEMQAHLYLGESYFRARDFKRSLDEFQSSLAMANELGTLEEQWKSLYGLGRIAEVSKNDSAAEDYYRKSIAVIEKTRSQLQLSALRAEFFADKREAYDALLGLLFQKNDASEAFLFLERARARNFQDRLFGPKENQANPLTLQEARSRLSPETTLLEFWTTGQRVGLIWCTKTASGIAETSIDLAQQTRVRDWLDRIPSGTAKDWRSDTQVLREVLPPLGAALTSETGHVIVVPDGWISYLPFDLMSVADDPQSLLIERYDVSYLPSAALLRRPAPLERTFTTPRTREMTAFGDPIVSGNNENGDDKGPDSIQPLAYSAEEIHSIASLVSGISQLFLKHEDLKATFLGGAANSAGLLHISTHAFADGNSPENSRMLFSSASAGSGPDYVFLRELYDLDLSSVRLATISACDTERGKLIRGEGVQAFSRALLASGSRSSLTTLWRVEDEATAEFMKQFYYFALEKHQPKAEALRLAKLKFLQSNTRLEHPRFWAAFILNGEGFRSLPSVLSWKTLVLLSLGILSLILSAVFLLWRKTRLNRLQAR